MKCPLCQSLEQKRNLSGADSRDYFLCESCCLIFVDPRQILSIEEARAHYQTHENSIENAGYVRFLNRVVEPMLRYLQPGMRGLDYGCGPGPTLSKLVQRHGMKCEDYDPLFANRTLSPPYDFVFSTETFEHFWEPRREIERITSLLHPGGWLGIMTELWTTPESFRSWYYTKDPTHVSFYHRDTLRYLCEQFELIMLETDGQRVSLFQRKSLS